MEFSERLVKVMYLRQLRRVDVCKICNISQSTLSLYLSNKTKPSLKTILKIAKALSINPDYLLGIVDELEESYLSELIMKILKMSRNEQIELLKYLYNKEDRTIMTKEAVWRN